MILVDSSLKITDKDNNEINEFYIDIKKQTEADIYLKLENGKSARYILDLPIQFYKIDDNKWLEVHNYIWYYDIGFNSNLYFKNICFDSVELRNRDNYSILKFQIDNKNNSIDISIVKNYKREKGLNHGLDITCTLSIFVPKPFTPFQWYGQMKLDEVDEHIRYLKEKTAHIKGLKINYHEDVTSQIEAVLTRGNQNLCRYIEALYKKGCYLDAWGEYFNKDIWHKTAEELGINLAELAQKQYSTEEVLPWDFINIGVDKDWFIKEFNDANAKPTCEKGCVNCGVCKNLKTRKILAKPFKAGEKAQKLKIEVKDPKTCQGYDREIFKYRIKLTKTGILKYFSHLDWQNTFFKALARTDLDVVYSLGYNPSMKVSMGIALPLFAESECELVDIELFDNLTEQELKLKLEKVLPEQSKIISIVKIEKNAPAIDMTAQWAEYKVEIFNKSLYDFENLRYNTDKVLSSEEIFIEKKNKKGLIKKTDIKQSIKSYRFKDESLFIVLKTGQSAINKADGTAESGIPALRADMLMNLIAPDVTFDIKRTRFFDKDLQEL